MNATPEIAFAIVDRARDLEKLSANAALLERFARVEGDGGLVIAPSGADLRAGTSHEVRLLFSGGTFGRLAGPWLFHVALRTPEDYRNEFLAWYEVEHLPMLLGAKGWDGCRFVEEAVKEGLLFHALHQLSDRSALDSQERKDSRATPWFKRLAQNSWFDSGFVRMLYKRV